MPKCPISCNLQLLSYTQIMKLFFLTICFVAVVFFASSCKDEYTFCETPTAVSFNNQFFKPAMGATPETPTLAPNLNIKLISSGTSIYSNQPNIIGFVLNLSPASDTARYQISIDNVQPKDTLTIVYNSTKVNLSAVCGDVFYKRILSYKTTTHTIDSVRLTNPIVTNIEVENARVFF